MCFQSKHFIWFSTVSSWNKTNLTQYDLDSAVGKSINEEPIKITAISHFCSLNNQMFHTYHTLLQVQQVLSLCVVAVITHIFIHNNPISNPLPPTPLALNPIGTQDPKLKTNASRSNAAYSLVILHVLCVNIHSFSLF